MISFWLPQKLRQSFNHIKKSRQLQFSWGFCFQDLFQVCHRTFFCVQELKSDLAPKECGTKKPVILQQFKFPLTGQQMLMRLPGNQRTKQCWWGVLIFSLLMHQQTRVLHSQQVKDSFIIMWLQCEAVRSAEWEKAGDNLSLWHHCFHIFLITERRMRFLIYTCLYLYAAQAALRAFQSSGDVMLMICSFFCLLKGNLNCLPDAGLALVMLKRVRVSAVNGYSGGVEVFLSSRLNFFFSPYWNTNCHVCLKLKCGVFLLAPLAWSLFIFKLMLSVTRITH